MRVQQAKDGDTVVKSPIQGGQFFICCLYSIDAPEPPKNGKSGQPYGEESTAVSDMYVQEAIINLLERKGILSKAEVIEKIKGLKAK